VGRVKEKMKIPDAETFTITKGDFGVGSDMDDQFKVRVLLR